VARTPKPSPEPDVEPSPTAPPAPLEHAAPNAEIAELAETDPVLGDGSGGSNGGASGGGSRRRRGGGGGDDSGGDLTPGDPDPGAEPDLTPAPVRRRNGLIAFAQGSWRELQRVQWPDQRQVMQATGVVIGFVIVAGAYLSLADWVANKIVHFILS
jgi:preprotein translocase subunit SecE